MGGKIKFISIIYTIVEEGLKTSQVFPVRNKECIVPH